MKIPAKYATALAIAAVGGGITLFAAAAVQQSYRQSANDPQIQLAQDAASALGRGTAPADIVGEDRINAARSLAPFVTIYDANRGVLATSGQFEGQTLSPPAGTFDVAKAHGQERFTWQTAGGIREATVLMYVSGDHPGYVLAARNLYEVEQREQRLRLMTLLTLAGVAAVALCVFLLVR